MISVARVGVLLLCLGLPVAGQAASGPQELVKQTTDQTLSRLQHDRAALSKIKGK